MGKHHVPSNGQAHPYAQSAHVYACQALLDAQHRGLQLVTTSLHVLHLCLDALATICTASRPPLGDTVRCTSHWPSIRTA